MKVLDDANQAAVTRSPRGREVSASIIIMRLTRQRRRASALEKLSFLGKHHHAE